VLKHRKVTKGIMKKIFGLLAILLLLTGCAESIALLGTSASNGKIVQSSLNSAISYSVKKQTGKTPLEHAIAYAEEKNPERKKEPCLSFIERTRSEFCTIAKKKISLTSTALAKKTAEIVKKFPKKNNINETSLIENIAKKSDIYNRR
tara:strand:- start:174 stop:617 length:444 start_codon:yes stop_codon:yes gene_type:complete